MPPLFLGDFGTIVGKCCPPELRDRERLSRPCTFGDARMVAFHDVPGTAEFVRLAVLTTTRSDREHQKCSAVPLDALQHRNKGGSELQITHTGQPQVVLNAVQSIFSPDLRGQYRKRKLGDVFRLYRGGSCLSCGQNKTLFLDSVASHGRGLSFPVVFCCCY